MVTEIEQVRRPPIDYTSRDFEAIRHDMLRMIPFFTPDWTDHNPTDQGIVILELDAAALDVLHYYIDAQAQELAFGTCRRRKSAVAHLKLIGYTLKPPEPSSVDLVFSLDSVLAGDLTIPFGTQVSTKGDNPIFFETVEAMTIPAGSLGNEQDAEGNYLYAVGAEEGKTETEDMGLSDGLPYQKPKLEAAVIIEGSLTPYVDEGLGWEAWEVLESLALATGTEKAVSLERDENDLITVVFGDNVQGKIPDPTSPMESRFRVLDTERGNVYGNVGEGTITNVISEILYLGNPVGIQVTNPEKASGGEPRETLEEAKRVGPRSIRALNRAVSLEDHETLSLEYPGVLKAAAAEFEALDCCGCGVRVSIVPSGGGQPSSVLLEGLLAYLKERSILGRCVDVQGTEYVGIESRGTVYVGGNYSGEETEGRFNQTLEDFFSLAGEQAEVGQDFRLSDFYAALDRTEGVDYVDLTKATMEPEPDYEVWTGDPTKIVDPNTGLTEGAAFGRIDVGENAQEETWTVILTEGDPCKFTVRGSVSGLQQAEGQIGQTYISDDGRVTFRIASGQMTPHSGDRATFRTSRFLANVPISPTQVMEKGLMVFAFVGGTRTIRPCQ